MKKMFLKTEKKSCLYFFFLVSQKKKKKRYEYEKNQELF